MFAVLAQLSENFIFIYLGLNLFIQDVQVFKPLFILVSAVSWTILACLLADAVDCCDGIEICCRFPPVRTHQLDSS